MRTHGSAFRFLACLAVMAYGQSVGIGTAAPHSSARLHVEDTERGILIPRLTTAQRNSIGSPATGLLIYNTDCNRFQYYMGSAWVSLALQPGTWCAGSSWGYRMPITITNANSYPLHQFQVMLVLNTAALVSAGKLQASGADMRFYGEDCQLLPHWVEEGMNTANTRVFVRVPFIPRNGTATIYLYYGNPTAVDIASPTATFDFWEDFNGNLGQFQTWNNPTYSIAGGILSFAGYGGFVLQSPLPYFLNNSSGSNTTGAFLEGRIRYTNNSDPYYSGNLEANSAQYGGCSMNTCGEAVIHYMREWTTMYLYVWVGNGAANTYNIYAPTTSCWTSTNNTWYVLSIKILPNQVFFWRDYGLQCQTGNFSWAKNLQWIILGEFEGNNLNCQDTDYDWIRVRKAAAAEPSFSVGAEETPSACN